MLASEGGHVETVNALLAKGANVEAKSEVRRMAWNVCCIEAPSDTMKDWICRKWPHQGGVTSNRVFIMLVWDCFRFLHAE